MSARFGILTGATVKPHTERRVNAFSAVRGGGGGGGGPVLTELTTGNYLHIVFGIGHSPLALAGGRTLRSFNAAEEKELFVDGEKSSSTRSLITISDMA